MGPSIPGQPWGTEVRKIALDASLPIAAVVFGVATVGGTDTAIVMESILENLPVAMKRDHAAVTTMLASLLHPGILAMRASAPPALTARVRLEIAMGFALPEGMVLRWIEIDDNVRLGQLTTGVIKPTEALESYFSAAPYIDDESRFGPATEGKVETAARVHAMLTQGIAEEERLLGTNGIKAGLGVDIAIIDTYGARLWDDQE